jgi:hypothetical protein
VLLAGARLTAQRVLVLGGAGNFGARIVQGLLDEPDVELLVAGRRAPDSGPDKGRAVVLDIAHGQFPDALSALAPQLVIHCIGPFQGQDYRVARAALAAGAHYLDLADGRDFVTEFAMANDHLARASGRVAISGASTLPALSSAVVDHLAMHLAAVESIQIAIAPGQRAARGVATMRAVFSYLGSPVKVWERGGWRTRTGWMNMRRVPMSFGTRWGALCDVPDLALFPGRYPAVQTVSFHAALEFRAQHVALWLLAGLRRLGLPLPVMRWVPAMDRLAGWFDRFAGQWGGMRVSIVGRTVLGSKVRRTWQLTAPAEDGPQIPCMAAILMTRRLFRGEHLAPGARTCVGLIPLDDFAPEFARWGMTSDIHEEVL